MVTKTKDGWYDTVEIPTGNQLVPGPTITGNAPGNGILIKSYTSPPAKPIAVRPNRKGRRRAAALARRRT